MDKMKQNGNMLERNFVSKWNAEIGTRPDSPYMLSRQQVGGDWYTGIKVMTSICGSKQDGTMNGP
jgi:hypothetical protein